VRSQRWIIVGVAVVLVIIGLLSGIFLRGLAGGGSGPKIYNTTAVVQQVQTLSQLVTVKYVMEKVEVLEDPSQNPLRYLWPTYDNTRVILVAHGIVKAGVDLSKLSSADVTVSGKKILVRLPPAQITDAYLDEHKTQVIEHTTGLFHSYNKDLEQTTRQNAMDDIRRAARSNGIIKDAEERAQMQLKVLLLQVGFEQVEFASK